MSRTAIVKYLLFYEAQSSPGQGALGGDGGNLRI